MEILCSICCCNLVDPKQEIGLPFSSAGGNNNHQAYSSLCGHVFHKICLLKWQERSKNCPECRTVINGKEDIHKVYFNVNFKSDEESQQDVQEEKIQMHKRTETLTKYIKHITKELGHVELKFDKLKQEIARKDQEISDLKNLLNQERLCVPLRRVTLKTNKV
ncbi:CLUMA_CG016276, isoform A [Clunio marinus]|uniref:CLUMA_CG016276, isoform A n=1 Tax=Clunio marinus TaxID=568069 RepID=A0A1J1IV15_9DIPT|nr:CLUMA_CG016276, isoform A [Clunio marinus]